jgi:hypothetical protein
LGLCTSILLLVLLHPLLGLLLLMVYIEMRLWGNASLLWWPLLLLCCFQVCLATFSKDKVNGKGELWELRSGLLFQSW